MSIKQDLLTIKADLKSPKAFAAMERLEKAGEIVEYLASEYRYISTSWQKKFYPPSSYGLNWKFYEMSAEIVGKKSMGMIKTRGSES